MSFKIDRAVKNIFGSKKLNNTTTSNISNHKSKKNTTHNNNKRKRFKSSESLELLKSYVMKKASVIVNSKFEEFQKLYRIYDDKKPIKYIESHIKITKDKIKEQIRRVPDKFLWTENKDELESFVSSDNLKFMSVDYFFDEDPENIFRPGNISVYYNQTDVSTDEINTIITKVLKIIIFYVKYVITNNYLDIDKKKKLEKKLPNIKIFYIDKNKCLPTDRRKILGQVDVNSALTLENEIIIYRKQELLKIIIHELQHFFRIDFGGVGMNIPTKYMSDLLKKQFNISREDGNNLRLMLEPTESYAEVNATILNTIFSTNPFNKDKLIKNLFT